MKTLIIVARDSMLTDLEHVLHRNGVQAYTILKTVIGKGVTGSGLGTFLHPEINTIISSVLPADLADRAVTALKSLHAEQKKGIGGDRAIPLKVFSFLCEEHISSRQAVTYSTSSSLACNGIQRIWS